MSVEDIGAEELLARLSGNDSRDHVADLERAVRATWRRAIDAVRRQLLAPHGMRLRQIGRDRGDLVIWLDSAEEALPVRPDRLLVPIEVIVEAHPLRGGRGGVQLYRSNRGGNSSAGLINLQRVEVQRFEYQQTAVARCSSNDPATARPWRATAHVEYD
ncbi:hypothetical protein [Actinomycetospora flava]|uniref:Uncharacterized protein n=1 Tax=Actinomycetospora flava TaxID=3129232 RepID=A0ABU8M7B1_9PSEU